MYGACPVRRPRTANVGFAMLGALSLGALGLTLALVWKVLVDPLAIARLLEAIVGRS